MPTVALASPMVVLLAVCQAAGVVRAKLGFTGDHRIGLRRAHKVPIRDWTPKALTP